jgi:hypothetical protein
MDGTVTRVLTPTGRLFIAAEFYLVADVPPDVEWFAQSQQRPHANIATTRVYDHSRPRPEDRRLTNQTLAAHPPRLGITSLVDRESF